MLAPVERTAQIVPPGRHPRIMYSSSIKIYISIYVIFRLNTGCVYMCACVCVENCMAISQSNVQSSEVTNGATNTFVSGVNWQRRVSSHTGAHANTGKGEQRLGEIRKSIFFHHLATRTICFLHILAVGPGYSPWCWQVVAVEKQLRDGSLCLTPNPMKSL